MKQNLQDECFLLVLGQSIGEPESSSAADG